MQIYKPDFRIFNANITHNIALNDEKSLEDSYYAFKFKNFA